MKGKVAIIFLLFASLPFQQAFTIDLGFPLKICEVASILLCLSSFSFSIPSSRIARPIVYALLIFLLFYVVSLLHSLYVPVSAPAYYRLGSPVVHRVLALFLVFLNIVVFLVLAGLPVGYCPLIKKAYYFGFFIAIGLHLLSILIVLLGFTSFSFPGQDSLQFASLGGALIPRCGVFAEGNYAGLYYITIFILSFLFRDWRIHALSWVGLLVSFSTIAIMSAIVYYISLFLFSLFSTPVFTRKFKILHLFSAPLFLLVLLVAFSPFIGLIFGKLFVSSSTDYGLSSLSRYDEFQAGVQIFLDHPVWGAGVGAFSELFSGYSIVPLSVSSYFDMPRVANNAYVQILADAGLIPSVFFFIFLSCWVLLLATFRKCPALAAVPFPIVVYLNAFPSYSSLLFYAFAGFTITLVKEYSFVLDGSRE